MYRRILFRRHFFLPFRSNTSLKSTPAGQKIIVFRPGIKLSFNRFNKNTSQFSWEVFLLLDPIIFPREKLFETLEELASLVSNKYHNEADDHYHQRIKKRPETSGEMYKAQISEKKCQTED